jgi:hypothetical protein
MARRRTPTVADRLPGDGSVPAELARFRLEDWADEQAIPPAWWVSEAAFWRYLRARLAHLRACQAFQRERSMTAQEFDRARGACGPDCDRGYPHWHG